MQYTHCLMPDCLHVCVQFLPRFYPQDLKKLHSLLSSPEEDIKVYAHICT